MTVSELRDETPEEADEELTQLVGRLTQYLGRVPEEDEVIQFIFGDDEDRLRIINSV